MPTCVKKNLSLSLSFSLSLSLYFPRLARDFGLAYIVMCRLLTTAAHPRECAYAYAWGRHTVCLNHSVHRRRLDGPRDYRLESWKDDTQYRRRIPTCDQVAEEETRICNEWKAEYATLCPRAAH